MISNLMVALTISLYKESNEGIIVSLIYPLFHPFCKPHLEDCPTRISELHHRLSSKYLSLTGSKVYPLQS